MIKPELFFFQATVFAAIALQLCPSVSAAPDASRTTGNHVHNEILHDKTDHDKTVHDKTIHDRTVNNNAGYNKADNHKAHNEKSPAKHKRVSLQIHINAPAHLVWEAIKENRNSDPDVQYSKFTDLSECERILEQKYVSLPVFGATTCKLKLQEERHKRIDYTLISSDRLKEFEGSWVLSSDSESQETDLQLSNYVRLKLPIPQRLIDAFAEPKMKARLLWVKELAESKHKLHIASNH